MEIRLKNINFKAHGVTVNVDMGRLASRLNEAQYWLDSQIMTDMLPYMPMDTGIFQNATRIASKSLAGSSMVMAAIAPAGRYLYYGKVMVDSQTRKGPFPIETGPGEYILRYHKGAKLVPTDRPLQYSQSNTRPEWFEVAKAQHLQSWIDGVKARIGGR